MSIRLSSIALVLSVAAIVSGCGNGGDAPPPATASNAAQTGSTAKSDILETAASAGQFKTLLAAIKAADLETTLKGDGPFTVFAPTDEAFAKLPAGTVETLLKPENKAKLASILTYHVVSGNVMAAQATKLSSAKTCKLAKSFRWSVVLILLTPIMARITTLLAF